MVFLNSANDDVRRDIEWSEDIAHNMVSCKAFDLTFKFYDDLIHTREAGTKSKRKAL